MGINSINSINPFLKPFGANVYGGSATRAISQASIFGQNNGGNEGSAKAVGSSIFNTNINVGAVTGTNPFAAVGKVSNPFAGITPAHAKENYRNGLAPADNLQNVYAGTYNGKANILNQIAIA